MPETSESMEHVAMQVKIALQAANLSEFSDLLDPNVRWGPPGDQSPPCTNREQVLDWYRHGKDSGANAHVSEVTVLGDRLLVELVVAGTRAARKRSGKALRWQVLTVRDGRVVEIVGFDQQSEALAWAARPAA